ELVAEVGQRQAPGEGLRRDVDAQRPAFTGLRLQVGVARQPPDAVPGSAGTDYAVVDRVLTPGELANLRIELDGHVDAAPVGAVGRECVQVRGAGHRRRDERLRDRAAQLPALRHLPVESHLGIRGGAEAVVLVAADGQAQVQRIYERQVLSRSDERHEQLDKRRLDVAPDLVEKDAGARVVRSRIVVANRFGTRGVTHQLEAGGRVDRTRGQVEQLAVEDGPPLLERLD